VDESTLIMSKYNGSWITDPPAFANNFGVNTAENYVFANITNFGGIFVPLGVQKPIQPVPAISIEGVIVLTGMLCFTAMVALRKRRRS
jgi:hypothetical protein